MKFILNKDKLEIDEKESLNSGSVKYYEIPVEHDDTWNDVNIEAVIIKENADKGIGTAVINNKVYIDRANYGKYNIGFKGYTVEYNLTSDVAIDNDKTYYTRSGSEGSYVYTKVDNPVLGSIGSYYEATKTYQISTKLTPVTFKLGAGEVEVENESEIPSISEWEVYVSQIEDMIDGLEDLIPTKLSDLENDNYTVTDENYVHTDNNFTDTYKSNVDSNTSARHTHSNKSILDGISESDITNWNGKYAKPSGGIPKTDLASAVQTSLGKADTSIQSIKAINGNSLIGTGSLYVQETLVSGTNIKTINDQSLLGSGNITIQGGGGTATDVQINGSSIVSDNVANIVTNTAYNASTNKIATMSDINEVLGNIETLLSAI